ncbi:MAG: hypothetical protein Q9208_006030 [Pyrenodesmia sp. 3 TL-2023]
MAMEPLIQSGALAATKGAAEPSCSVTTASTFSPEDRMVFSKSQRLRLGDDPNGEYDSPTLLHALSPQNLLLATDSSALYLFDLRTNSTFQDSKPQQTYHPHHDYISSLTPLAPSESLTSGYCRQWFSCGGSTAAVTDIRKGVIFESVDYEEELLSGTVIGGQGNTRIIAGSEKGFARIWDEGVRSLINGKERRLYVEKGETLDAICPVRDRLIEEDLIAVGLGDGTVSFARTGKKSGVVGRVRHDELEGVVALGFDPDGRLITGGGTTVKVWEKSTASPGDEADSVDERNSSDEETDEVDSESHHKADQTGHDETEDGSSEEENPKRKRRKRNKGKGKNNNSHILAFKGMD